jgi:hypothetical protein
MTMMNKVWRKEMRRRAEAKAMAAADGKPHRHYLLYMLKSARMQASSDFWRLRIEKKLRKVKRARLAPRGR